MLPQEIVKYCILYVGEKSCYVVCSIFVAELIFSPLALFVILA